MSEAETRARVIQLLRSLVESRPSLALSSYNAYRAYKDDSNKLSLQLRDARRLLDEIDKRKRITCSAIIAGVDSGNGRLQLRNGSLTYVAGQYYPMEYRAAVCAAAARILTKFWATEPKSAVVMSRAALGTGIIKRWFDN